MQIGPKRLFVWDIPRSLGQTWALKFVEFSISYFTMWAIRQPLIKKEERERRKKMHLHLKEGHAQMKSLTLSLNRNEFFSIHFQFL